MSNTNLKGRATATFNVVSSITDGVLRIVVTADATEDDFKDYSQTANGTVALGKMVAEEGKAATPVTASERKLAAQVALYMESGLDLETATAIAAQVNSL